MVERSTDVGAGGSHSASRRDSESLPEATLGGEAKAERSKTYRYDPHLPPRLRFDQTGEADELPALLQKAVDEGLEAEDAMTLFQALRQRQPWLEWTGKRHKSQFEVKPIPLTTHEHISARAILRALERSDVNRTLFDDPQDPSSETIRFYEHDPDWSNRIILGDSLEVMASLVHRENLAGQVQMIYLDPPYGINYKSNFQPSVGSRSYRETYTNLTREAEMVKAYRDTWRLGIHSYLDYLRDRLVLCRNLLRDTGSIFVQIGDENAHLVRNVLDEVFGVENYIVQIVVQKTGSFTGDFVKSNYDYLLWYAKDREQAKSKFRRLFRQRKGDPEAYSADPLTSSGATETSTVDFEVHGRTFHPGANAHWKTHPEGMERLRKAERIVPQKTQIRYKRYYSDYPVKALGSTWFDTGGARNMVYVVQTATKVVKRCILMTTDPGDLVLDPTCGSGTTAYVAEKWGRRWIAIDTSRVAIALARQRLLTASYPMFKTKGSSGEAGANPAKGFFYETVPHIRLRDIANNAALDLIFERYEPLLDEKLSTLNDVLRQTATDELRRTLASKLRRKQEKRGKRGVTEVDRRRWILPEKGEGWEHWEVPFDADEDWPPPLQEALTSYRATWREKMDAVNAAIAEGSEKEVLYDKPEVVSGVTRVSGPFEVQAVMPPALSWDGTDASGDNSRRNGRPNGTVRAAEGRPHNAGAYLDKMTLLMAEDGVRFMGNTDQEFEYLERAPHTHLHAEGVWMSGGRKERVAVSFGPEHGAVTSIQVEHAILEAERADYDAVIFAGFSFDAAAQSAIQEARGSVGAHLAHIRPDVVMEDLLHRPTKEQIFTVFGLPRTQLRELDDGAYQIAMEGVDVYDPVEGQVIPTEAQKVAAWFVDTDYDGRTFCISQAFFPKKRAWRKLQRALRSRIEKAQFNRLTGTTSLPFTPGEHRCVAVKVIDPRGNEVMRLHKLE